MSLIELLVATGIVALLLMVLLPAIQASREAARRTQCQANLRNWGVALNSYLVANRMYPPAATWHTGRPNRHKDFGRHSVFAFLLPHIEQTNTFRQLDLRRDWNSKRNESIAKQTLGGILLCPSAPGGRTEKHASDYTTIVRVDPATKTGLGKLIVSQHLQDRSNSGADQQWGAGTQVWDGLLPIVRLDKQPRIRQRVRPKDVQDGQSKTIAFVENAGKPICFRFRQRAKCHITRFRWASPTIWMALNDVCGEQQLVNCHNNSQPYAFHPNVVQTVHADGSVHAVSDNIAADLFVSAVTRAAND